MAKPLFQKVQTLPMVLVLINRGLETGRTSGSLVRGIIDLCDLQTPCAHGFWPANSHNYFFFYLLKLPKFLVQWNYFPCYFLFFYFFDNNHVKFLIVLCGCVLDFPIGILSNFLLFFQRCESASISCLPNFCGSKYTYLCKYNSTFCLFKGPHVIKLWLGMKSGIEFKPHKKQFSFLDSFFGLRSFSL